MGTFRKSQHRRGVKHIAAHAAEFLEIRRVLSAAVAPGLGISQFSVGSTSPEGLPFPSAIFLSAIQGVGGANGLTVSENTVLPATKIRDVVPPSVRPTTVGESNRAPLTSSGRDPRITTLDETERDKAHLGAARVVYPDSPGGDATEAFA